MKLQNLVENIQRLTPNHFKDFQFTMDGVEAVMEFFEALKGFRFVDVVIGEDEVSIEATNSLVTVWLHIIAEPNHVFTCSAQLSIADALMAVPGAEQVLKTLGGGATARESDIETALKGAWKEVIVKSASAFTEWYFDMSGEHGKLKVAIWRRASNDVKVVAIGGSYNMLTDDGAVL